MINRFLSIVATLLVAIGIVVGGCAAPAATPTPTPTPPSPIAPAAPKELKIGINMAQNWSLGIDSINAMKVESDRMKEAGGLDIGGQKYNINFIADDNKMDLALVKTVGQKQIFQDGVKFILSDPSGLPLFQLCEENKVAGIFTMYDFEVYDTKWHYQVNCGGGAVTFASFVQYVAKRFPNLKTVSFILPDRRDGRVAGEFMKRQSDVAGLTSLEYVYYPTTNTDLSAVGTKIKTINPDICICYGGGPPADAGSMRAAYQAGYRGQFVEASTAPGAVMLGIAGPEAVEGMIGWAWPFEFDPATTPEAATFKAAYIAKYGKWNSPEIIETVTWFNLRDAMIQADSVDVETVLAKMKNGSTFKCALGSGARFARNDFNNPATVDAVIGNLPVKQIKNGKVVQIDTVPLEVQLERVLKAYSEPWYSGKY